ncbi:outer membrane lipoprotein MapA [Campylobacter coli]|uniref:outer membrane lipoprotein MapA n=1 Tax=Campylobacter coli TaxID=195 RepID=UPI0025AF68D1|nr:outer membrane lipoprotein MapA [Campylobacter coli]MDN2883031.1 outer membrane lipoprotein MapA [Campylobacter coli]
MFKKFLIFIVPILFLSACATKQDTFAQVNQISKNSQCSSCESPGGFEAKIKGLLYISDVGIQCCANKRTLDTGIALKKVYLHRFYDLKEGQKVLNAKGKKLFVDVNFNAVFYTYLKQELEARGIIVLDDNKANSPYVTKIDLAFTGYSAKQDSLGLHSRLVGVLSLSDINKNKKFTLRTKQDVQGFENLKDISFYTHLLIKQMANKAASIISEL